MKGTVGRLAAVMALFAAVPAAAQSDPPPTAAEQPAVQLLAGMSHATPPADRLALLDRVLALMVQPTPLRGRMLCLRGMTLAQLGRMQEARSAVQQCRVLRVDDPNAMLALAGLDANAHQPVEAAQMIARAVSISPDALQAVDPDMIDTLFRELRYVRADRVADTLTTALAEHGWGREHPDSFADLAVTAMRTWLATGRRADALGMLPSVLSPQRGVELLIDRRFAPIWPDIEAWAGADLSVQRRALLDAARSSWEVTSSPADLVRYSRALETTGHRAESIELLQRWLDSPAGKVDEWYEAAAVVRLGAELAEDGRRPEAIARMQAALSAPGTGPGRPNIVPNLVIQQLLAHDYAGALAVLDRFTPAVDKVEVPAALGYFVALRACALAGSGQASAAAAGLAQVQTTYATNDHAVDIATYCVAGADQQAARWIVRADNDDFRGTALLNLATARYRLAHGRAPRSLEEAALMRIGARPDVSAAYDRLARPLPDRYAPALGQFAGLPDVPREGPVPTAPAAAGTVISSTGTRSPVS